MKRRWISALGMAALAAASSVATAQSNALPGLDVELAFMSSIDAPGRSGVFPNGMNGVAFSTTICNKGNTEVNWFAAMNPDHPFISFILARETDGRLTQISDWSYVKHGFFALASSQCNSCQTPTPNNGTVLGINCSDTYAVSNNGDNYWLGPPWEIDPWLGLWDPMCSHFDVGEPSNGTCNGGRSLSSGQAAALGPVGHRINVPDAELDADGTFWYQGYYVVRREPEANRENNLSTRGFNPTWSAGQQEWNLTPNTSLQHGSILKRWVGATVSSAANGAEDGRVYVGVKVAALGDGMTRFEYAIHNRDNLGGIGSFRMPVCDEARIENYGFHDVDGDAGNDWTMTRNAGELVFASPVDGGSQATNPIQWNSFYNFYFDSDAVLDKTATIELEQATLAPGAAASFSVGTSVPGPVPNVHLGDGCSNGPDAPTLYAVGTPAQAKLGNATFGLESTGNVPGEAGFLYRSKMDGTFSVSGCDVYMVGNIIPLGGGVFVDGTGLAHWNAPIPNNANLEGQHLNVQAIMLNPGGPLFGAADLTDGLRVRIGNNITDCP